MATTLGTVDVGGDGKVVLITNLNYKLKTNFSLDDFEFGEPKLVTIPGPTHNTVIDFGPKAHSGWYGIRKIYYNRVHVSELGTIKVTKGTATRVSHLLQAVNEKYGILVTELDIYDSLLPSLPPGETEIEVNFDFRPTSIIYYGSTKIIMGLNDPSLIDPNAINLSFTPTWLFFAEDIRSEKMDAYSITVDRDRARKRVSNTIVGSSELDIGLMYQRQITPDESTGYLGHIVNAWQGKDSETVHALNIYGHVLDRSTTGHNWVKTGDIGNVPMADINAVDQAQIRKPFKFVLQGADSAVYVFYVGPIVTQLKKSVDYGKTWTDILFVGSALITDPALFNQGYVHILDKMIAGEYMYMLVHITDPMQTKLKVWKINLGTGEVNIKTLHDQKIRYTQLELYVSVAPDIRGSFISTQDNTLVWPGIALLSAVKDSHQQEVFCLDYHVIEGVYHIKSTAKVQLYPNQKDYKGSFISAYSWPLNKNADIHLDVIEVGTMIESGKPDYEAYVQNQRLRTESAFYSHGVVAMTSLRMNGERNTWRAQSIALGTGETPQRMIFQKLEKRVHYVAQPENGIQRLSFTEDNQINGFTMTYDARMILPLEAHTGYSHLSDMGIGLVEKADINETLNTNYGYTPYANQELALSDIQYSFIGRNSAGAVVWLTAPDTANSLTARQYTPQYGFMGDVPIASFTAGDSLYVVTSGNKGVYKRDHADKSWSYHGAMQAVIESHKPQYVGWSTLQLGPEDFKEFIYDGINQKYRFHLKVNRQVSISTINENEFNTQVHIQDEALVELSKNTDAGYPSDKAYTQVDILNSHGYNPMANEAPRQFQFLTPTAGGEALYTAKTSQNALYDNQIDNYTLPTGFPANVTVRDIRAEVSYLDIKSIYLVETAAGVTQLIFQDKTDALTVKELYGGTDAATSSFKPEAIFHLYEFVDTNYVPLVYYHDKTVLLMGKLNEQSQFPKTLHVFTIPSDNNTPLKLIPVFSNNRYEYLFFQKGNGIFKLNYTYNNDTRMASFNLVRLFDLSTSNTSIDIVSGSITNFAPVTHPGTPLIPTYPSNGTLLSTYCKDTTKMGRYADGNGGFYLDTIAVNSTDCGYVAPAPGVLLSDAVTLTASLTHKDNTNITVSTVQAGENGDEAFAIYTLANALTNNITLDASIIYDTAHADDIAQMQLTIGTGTPVDFIYPGQIVIPAGETSFKLSFKFIEDNKTEGDEVFSVRVRKQAGEQQISNADPIVVVFKVIDTSQSAPPVPPAPPPVTP